MFLFRRSYMGVGMVMGMVVGAAAVSAAVLACPQGRGMARHAVKRGRRMVKKVAPMLEKRM